MILAAFSFLTFLSPPDSSSPTGQSIHEISYLNKGKMLRLVVKDVPEVEFVHLTAKESVKLDEVNIFTNNDISFSDFFLSKFTISSNQPENYELIRLTFRIKESSLLERGISQSNLRLYHNGNLVPLNFNKFSGGYLYYTAESKKMGDFVLGAVKSS